jgi:hypothetical protein
MPRGAGAIHWEIAVGGWEHRVSSLAHAPPMLRQYGIEVSASRLYNEVRDRCDAARGLPVRSERRGWPLGSRSGESASRKKIGRV